MQHHFCQSTMSGCEVLCCQHLLSVIYQHSRPPSVPLIRHKTSNIIFNRMDSGWMLNVHKYGIIHREQPQLSASFSPSSTFAVDSEEAITIWGRIPPTLLPGNDWIPRKRDFYFEFHFKIDLLPVSCFDFFFIYFILNTINKIYIYSGSHKWK